MDSFENYLLFAGAVNLGFTLFSQLKNSIIKSLEKYSVQKRAYYASILDVCKTSKKCYKCGKYHCRHCRSNKETFSKNYEAMKNDVLRKISKKTDASLKLVTCCEKCSIVGAIISVNLIAFIEACIIPSMQHTPSLLWRIVSLCFLFPFFLMTIGVYILNYIVLKFCHNPDNYIKDSFCENVYDKAMEEIKNIEKDDIESIDL